MIDAAFIQQCADPGLKPAIVERFVDRVGSPSRFDPVTGSY